MRRRLVTLALLCTLGACSAQAIGEPRPPARAPAVRPASPGTSADPALAAADAIHVAWYVAAVQDAELRTYLETVAAAEAAAAQAARAQRPVSQPTGAAQTSGATGACGGATNGADAYISRESGGNPGVYNTGGSGAWGCYQLMPEHFAPGGSCSDMVYGQASAAQQAECASRLPLSAWGG